MKEDMYTYHYFKNRTIIKPERTGSYIFDTVVLASVVFMCTAVIYLVK